MVFGKLDVLTLKNWLREKGKGRRRKDVLTSKRWPAVLVAGVLLVAAVSVPAIEAKPLVVRAGLDFRSVKTHFSDDSSYYLTNFGYSTINTWETFSLFGVKGDLLWRERIADQLCLEFGLGLGLYPISGYSCEVGNYTGRGDAGFGFEIDVPVRLSYLVTDQFSVFGRLGSSILFVSGSVPDDPLPETWDQWFYDGDFWETLPDIYFGLGADYKFTPAWALSFLFRITLFGLGASTDYGLQPVSEGFSNLGVSARIVYEFGGKKKPTPGKKGKGKPAKK
ncbi:hypothetical protein ES705_02210 [subsurface metagenome]|nr:outer membrane beta-barrel protein [Clostridia bacterium]